MHEIYSDPPNDPVLGEGGEDRDALEGGKEACEVDEEKESCEALITDKLIENLENPTNLAQISFGDFEMNSILPQNLHVHDEISLKSTESHHERCDESNEISSPTLKSPSNKMDEFSETQSPPLVEEIISNQIFSSQDISLVRAEHLNNLPRPDLNLEESCKTIDLDPNPKILKKEAECCENIEKQEQPKLEDTDPVIDKIDESELKDLNCTLELFDETRSYLHVTKTNLKTAISTEKSKQKKKVKLVEVLEERTRMKEDEGKGAKVKEDEGKEETLKGEEMREVEVAALESERIEDDSLELSAPDIARLDQEEAWVQVPVTRSVIIILIKFS